MPYTFAQADNVLAIAERRYGSGRIVRFTRFTSCLGLLGRKGNTVRGVHLSTHAQDGTVFNNDAADLAIGHLDAYDQLVLIGHINTWQQQLPGPYARLHSQLSNPIPHDVANGDYGGQVEDGIFQLYMNGDWVGV